MTKDQVAVRPANEVASVGQLLELAIQKDMGVEGLEKLMALHERYADRMAAQEFADALAQFQEECPPIKKSAKAAFATKSGSKVSYTYAPLDQIARTVRPILHKHGLSYSWDTTVDGGNLMSVCHLRHRNGHSETSTFACPIDSNNPLLSSPQKVAVSNTFAHRQSLVAVLGLTSTDEDTDAQEPENQEPVSADQLTAIEDAITGLDVDKAKFFKMLKMSADSQLSDIPASQYARVMLALKRKREASK